MFTIHLLGAALNFTNEGETSPFGTQYSGAFVEQHESIVRRHHIFHLKHNNSEICCKKDRTDSFTIDQF